MGGRCDCRESRPCPFHATVSKTIGSSVSLNTHHGELVALYETCELIDQCWPDQDTDPRTLVWVFSCSRAALQVLGRPGQQPGQWIVRKIYKLLGSFAASWKPRVVFQWLPDQGKIGGSGLARNLAPEATQPNRQTPKGIKLKLAALRRPPKPGYERRRQFDARRGGRYTKQVDQALPGIHTRKVYDNLNRDEAQILVQLRTGENRLNKALHGIKAVDSDSCERCHRPETVRQFLVECPRWAAQQQQQQHLQATTDRWVDVSFLLGGWTNEWIDGPLGKRKPNMAAVRATISFAKATGRLDAKREERR